MFSDPQLQELIRTALKHNHDLQLAVERVNAARARAGIARSNQFPTVLVNPEFSGGKTDQNIKLFGRYRRASEAATPLNVFAAPSE